MNKLGALFYPNVDYLLGKIAVIRCMLVFSATAESKAGIE